MDWNEKIRLFPKRAKIYLKKVKKIVERMTLFRYNKYRAKEMANGFSRK